MLSIDVANYITHLSSKCLFTVGLNNPKVNSLRETQTSKCHAMSICLKKQIPDLDPKKNCFNSYVFVYIITMILNSISTTY